MAKRKKTDEIVDEVVTEAKSVVEKERSTKKNTLPSGVTLFNLATTQTLFGAFRKGTVTHVIGPSSSGKTFIVVNALAAVTCDPAYDDYEIIYYDVERAFELDLEYLFGPVVAERITFPDPPQTVEEWETLVYKLHEKDKKFVMVMDSYDALTTEAEMLAEKKRAAGKDVGTMGTEKAKGSSNFFRKLTAKISECESHLFVISQQRQKIGVVFGDPRTWSGGESLKFYSTLQLFLAGGAVLKDKKYEKAIGTKVKCQIKKNKLDGKPREFEFNIYNDYGIDNVGSCIDYLIAEKHWEKEGRSCWGAKEFDFVGTKEEIIDHIESNDLEQQLDEVVKSVWLEIEKAISEPFTKRKKRFK